MINEVTNTRSKMKKLERLIESTSFDGERSVAKKKYTELKQNLIKNYRKYSIIRSLTLWCKPTDEQINIVYSEYCNRYNETYQKLRYSIPNEYIEATMGYWDYGFKIGLSKYRLILIPKFPYTPYALDYFLLGEANGFRLSLSVLK